MVQKQTPNQIRRIEELQQYVVYMAGVSAATKEPDAARALVRHLTLPAAASVLRSQGLDPTSP